MRKTMVRIFAVILVLAMAVGFLAMIPVSAATESVQIMGHNVYFDEYLQIMYAVYVPEGTTIQKIELSDSNNTFEAVLFDEKPVVDGKTCQAYVAAKGVSLQAIDTIVTAKVYVDDQVVAEDQYSILQYLRKRLYIDNATGDQKDLYTNLLATAESLQTVLPSYTEVTVNNYGYVYVENGTINGNKDAILVNGSVLTADMLAADGNVTAWNYEIIGGTSGVLTEAGLPVETNNIILTAEVDESGTTDPTEPSVPETTNRYYIATNRSSGNYFYMTSDLGTANTKRYQAVDSGLSVLPEKITGPLSGYVFVLEENEDGTYYIYAEISDSANYLGWASGNSGILVEKESAKALTVDKTEEGLYNIHFTNNSEERYLSLNGTTNNNYFAWYAGTQRQDLALIPVEECEHTYDEGVVTAPTCTEVGYTSYTCSKCGFINKDNEVAATGHLDTETTAAVEATCQTVGYTEGTYCNDCNTYVDGHTEIATVDCVYVDGICKWCGEADPDVGGGETDTPITASKTIADLITEYGWTSSTTKQSFNLDSNVSVKINGGSNTGKAYNGDHIRIYATDSPAGTITISVPEGYELVSIKVSTQTGTYAFLYVDGTTTDISNKTVEVSGNSVLLNSVKNGSNGKQVRVTAIEVVYKET